MESKIICVRLDIDTTHKLDKYCIEENKIRSKIIKRLIKEFMEEVKKNGVDDN